MTRQLLDLGDVVVGEQSLLSPETSCPPSGSIYATDKTGWVSDFHYLIIKTQTGFIFFLLSVQKILFTFNALIISRIQWRVLWLTFFDNVNNIISIEAEFVCVLSVVGIQSFALGHLGFGFGFGCRFWSSSSWWGPGGWWSVGPERNNPMVRFFSSTLN